MVSILSPGVYVVEKDISTYPVTIGGSTVGVVGFATKGPTNKATLITSAENLINTFGLPNADLAGQGLQGALEILEATNSLYYVRVANETAAKEASATIGFGSCAAVAVKSDGYGVSKNLSLVISGLDHYGNEIYPGGRLFSIPSGTAATQQTALVKVFGAALDNSPVTVQFPTTVAGDGTITPTSLFTGATQEAGLLVLSYAGSDARLYVSANAAVVTDVSKTDGSIGAYAATATASGQSYDTTAVKLLAESLWPGTGYNEESVDGVIRGNSVEVKNLGGSFFTVTVNQDGGTYESYKANLLKGANGLVKLISSDPNAPTSEVITADILLGAASVTALPGTLFTDKASTIFGGTVGANDARFVKLLAGSYGLSGGNDGSSSSDAIVIGSAAEKSGIYALDDDLLNLSIAVVPGLQKEAIQNELITLAQTTTNFIAVVAPPEFSAPTVQKAIDWSNGLSDERKSAINSSYAAIYWPNVKTFIPALGKDDWMDAAIYGARQIAYTANVSELWYAPAGFIRGRLTKPTETEVGLGQGDRDAMYSGGNVINPIVNFPQQGITIFGQRTAQREPSALDRINVRLLTIYLKKVLLRSVTRELFEPNDPILWDSVRTTATTVLEDIKLRRGITEYGVYCDESTNTPARIERNELWCKIVIKPTKTAEAIVFELNLASQSATIQ